MSSSRTRVTALTAVAMIALATAGSARAAMISVSAHSHPNGDFSANQNAVDSRDYGLRINDGHSETFHFEDVTMSFYNPLVGNEADKVYATLTGTIAHLQSSNGASLGFSATSGLDALDQRWMIEATFHLIDGIGPDFALAALPTPTMLSQLLTLANTSNAITFDNISLTLTPLFDEGSEAAIYTGPREMVGKSNGTAHHLMEYRHRLATGPFPSPDWDKATGRGWLMEDSNSPNPVTGDFLYYVNVPEPATLALLGLALPALLRKRRTAA